MPSVDENVKNWSSEWDWSQQGDEWSRWWGDTAALWHGVLLPRIHPFLPAGTILEIAPGFGRWTQYLKDQCQHLVLVDLTEKCIDHCRQRFSAAENITYEVNDGRSLSMVEDDSIDFVFSFDSLVHADAHVLGSYLEQVAHKLTPDGAGFIHHSNARTVRRLASLSRRLPGELMTKLVRRGIAVNVGAWRDETMSAETFRRQCDAAGLSCITQELVSWEHGGYLIDSFSIFTRKGSCWERPTRVLRNPMFVAEARRMARLYARTSLQAHD
jgi:2-polyprenyl-3-methyl-5-hydroxy-6-metoxy-1,4-benzoquinol methylase